jgi:hypothetical protein
MTAYADDATREEIRSKSCLFLEKPFNLAEVKRVVQEKLA